MASAPTGCERLLLPSFSADARTLLAIPGLESWPERQLIELSQLRQPGGPMLLITPVAVTPACLEAVLELTPGAPAAWLRRRLHCISLDDHSPCSLAAKVLQRPRLLEQLQRLLRPGALLASYAVGPEEMLLARRLGLRLEGSPAQLAELGTKAGSARVFADLGLQHPATTSLCHSLDALAAASDALLQRDPGIQSLVVKLNRMAGGRGNAPLQLPCSLSTWRQLQPSERYACLLQALEDLAMPLPHWREELRARGAIAQALITAPAGALRSPSAQLWITANGLVSVLSTHEQQLSGPHRQSFSGCVFPAAAAYRAEVMAIAARLGRHLAAQGCRGPVLLDLLARRQAQGWQLWPIEINLRKGGTSHPLQWASTLTGTRLDPTTGLLLTTDGRPVFYEACDGLHHPHWRGLLPQQWLDALVQQGRYLDLAHLRGCLPYRLGGLSEHGLVGVMAFGRSRLEAARGLRQLRQLS